jgi:flagellar basal-body rod modification protein FlgD
MLPLSATAPTDPAQAATSSASTSSSSSASSALAGATDQLTKESTFLQLLVAQIKNQDPLNPTDSIQFVGQLVQFSQLEQLLGINQGVQSLVGSTTATTATSGTPPPASNGG